MTDKPSFTIIPAQPGFAVVYYHPVDDRFEFGLPEPIIAWRIETKWISLTGEYSSASFPITLDGEPGGYEWGIAGPGGEITFPGDISFRTVDEALVYLASFPST